MEDITKLEDELQSLGGIVTYQKNRPSSVTIEVNTLNTYLHKACNQAYKNGFYAGQGMASVELDECHKNWEKLIAHTKDLPLDIKGEQE